MWLAIDKETREKKAIKIIPTGDVADMTRVDVEVKVRREMATTDVVQAMLMLKHPNIVSLEEVLETKESVFFVMPLCGGGSLSDKFDGEVSGLDTNLKLKACARKCSIVLFLAISRCRLVLSLSSKVFHFLS